MTNRRNIWLTVLVLSVAVVGLTAFFATLGPPQNPPPAPRSSRVEYRITGTAAEAAISYVNDIGVVEERSLPPPWTFGFRARAGRDLTVQVRRVGEAGAVGCAITIDRQIVVEVVPEEGRAEASCVSEVPGER